MLKILTILLITTTFACVSDLSQPPTGSTESFLMTEHTINGVHFSLSGASTVLANGETAWDATLIDQVSWATMQGLIGAVVEDVGTVSALGLRRRDPVPAGTAFKLITAPQ